MFYIHTFSYFVNEMHIIHSHISNKKAKAKAKAKTKTKGKKEEARYNMKMKFGDIQWCWFVNKWILLSLKQCSIPSNEIPDGMVGVGLEQTKTDNKQSSYITKQKLDPIITLR